MNLTDGELTGVETTTAGGHPAIAVEGFPADSVKWALANLDITFDVVVSGSNTGQNIGPLSLVSGTVGAARYAAQNGIPGVAVSQGAADVVDYPASVDIAVMWVDDHRDDYVAGTVSLWSINAPSCPDGAQGTQQVPLADDFGDRSATEVTCDSAATDFADDVDAFINGYVAISELPLTVEG
ncbi:MAG: 5'/3'-nucleotidase SurE [Acidimicrobiales bacterium]